MLWPLTPHTPLLLDPTDARVKLYMDPQGWGNRQASPHPPLDYGDFVEHVYEDIEEAAASQVCAYK